MRQQRITKRRRAREEQEDRLVELVRRRDGNDAADRAEEWLHANEWINEGTGS